MTWDTAPRRTSWTGARGALSFQTPTRLYRWAQLNANHWQHWTTSGLALETVETSNGHWGCPTTGIHAGGTISTLGETYGDR